MSQELNNLPADLQLAQVTMQVNPVQALQIERNVPIQHVVDCDRHRPLEPGRMATSATWLTHEGCAYLHGNACRTRNSAVSGGACLGEQLTSGISQPSGKDIKVPCRKTGTVRVRWGIRQLARNARPAAF